MLNVYSTSIALLVFAFVSIFITLDFALYLAGSNIMNETEINTLSTTNEKPRNDIVSSSLNDSKCNGTPQERRYFVKNGHNASEQDWLDMIECLEQRKNTLEGFYALHVSKSGGTSLCNLFKAEKCFVPPQSNPNANCWSPEYKRIGLSLGPQWLRKESREKLNLPAWMDYNEKTISSSCNELVKYLYKHKHKVAMSENWLPKGGSLCQSQFSSIFVMRHPIERVLSHYQHIFNVCMKRNDQNSKMCLTMLNGQEWDRKKQNTFNITMTAQYFDIITDNYYLRSLNDQSIYNLPFGMNGKGKTYLQRAINNLRSFDWIVILDEDSHNDDFDHDSKVNIDMIMKGGLGLLQHDFGYSRKRSDSSLDVSHINLRPRDVEQLVNINNYDLQLWYEAKKLNDLDVQFLNRSMQYQAMRSDKVENGISCCGHIC